MTSTREPETARTDAFTHFVERWRQALPTDIAPEAFDDFIGAAGDDLEEHLLGLAPITEQSLRAALGYAPQFGAVIHCDDFTLGAHPDFSKREESEVALLDWSQPGGVTIAEGGRAAALLLDRCGAVRALGALGRALLKRGRPEQRWLALYHDLAREAQDLEQRPGAPADDNLRLGLAIRAVAHERLGSPGTEADPHNQRPETVPPFDTMTFRHAGDIAHLKLSQRDRLFMANLPVEPIPSAPSQATPLPASQHEPIPPPPQAAPLPTWVRVLKGCPRSGIYKYEILAVQAIQELGKEHGYAVKLTLGRGGKSLQFAVRHINRLRDVEFNARRGSCVLRLEPRHKP